ncbi:MAG: hypothetical protein GX786_07675 [Clostridiales bacterium]|nr:hypothetical protein [Clostridiales bacterium]
MVLAQTIIRYIYILFTAITCFFLIKHLFSRKKHKGVVNDIVYALCIIPFLLRLLQIK